MACVKTTCPAALPIAGVVPSCAGALCRVETTEAGARGLASEASVLTERSDPKTLAAWCRGDYASCPTYQEDRKNRLIKPLADQE